MTERRRVIELSVEETDLARLATIAGSRAEPASRVERARMLPAYRRAPLFFAASRALGVHHQTMKRSIESAADGGQMAALEQPVP